MYWGSVHVDRIADHLYVVHTGKHRFALDDKITALPAVDALRDLDGDHGL